MSNGTVQTTTRRGRMAALFAVLAILAVCGASASSAVQAQQKIVGGQVTTIDKWPWQVALSYKKPSGAVSIYCGGSLLTPTVVLTAGHCVDVMEDTDFITAGATNWKTAPESARYEIEDWFAHPDFDIDTLNADIAIVTLAEPIGPGSGATPIKLAGPGEGSLWEAEDDAWVTGWGSTREGGNVTANLRQARVPIIADETCEDDYTSDMIIETMICAGFQAGGVDSCQGDSGGPLVVPASGGEGGMWRLVGSVSWGYGCAGRNEPGVYARVASPDLRAFIQDAVDDNGGGDVIGSGGTTGAPPDADGDTIPDSIDNCVSTPNFNQADADRDGVGDVCDTGGGDPDPTDSDADGVADSTDNCPAAPNPGQGDADGDGKGDACDTVSGGPGPVAVPDPRGGAGVSEDMIRELVKCSKKKTKKKRKKCAKKVAAGG